MLSTWSNKEDCCEWRGVHCDIDGRVTILSLPCFTDDFIIAGNKKNKTYCLEGKFHLTLFELEYLNYVDLSNNDFKAIHLPMDCKNLSLVKTPLHGSGNFSNVVLLDLSENENLVIDDLRWILRLSSSLEYLNLNFVDLHKETRWLQILTMFPSLSELYLSNCLLESVNPSLLYANFTSLKYLDLSFNDFFSELPIWLFNISGLSYLDLRTNRFHGQIPKTLLNLRNLDSLYLRNNKLSGTIPDWLGQLRGLQNLVLGYNSFTGSIPTSFGNLSSLIFLSVSSNHLTGTLPESLGQLSNLEILSVRENSLSGVVSKRNFAKLSKLQMLGFGSPSLVLDFDPNWIPPFKLVNLVLEYVDLKLLPWFKTQTSLFSIAISHSLLKNVSQEMFWNLTTNCQYLYLYKNTMPWDMSNVLLNSEIVWLDGNGLSGGLPRLTSNVSFLFLKYNKMSGSLSPLLCHNLIEKSNLKYFDVSYNHLSGELTDCWVNWKSLTHVDLGNNNLTGMIPHSMGSLSNLLSLNIYGTKLHGEIPLSLKNCQKVEIVNLSGNKFSGNIPNWFGQNLKALQLRSNEFSGDIPQQICQLSSLMVLDLANNRLTGTIPHCLHNITSMIFNNVSGSDQFGIMIKSLSLGFVIKVPLLTKGNYLHYREYMHVIDLSNNHLSGRIPLEVFRLIALQSLNLSQNQLTGTIPKEIGNMKALESLDFSNNTLSGEIPQTMSTLSFLEVLNLSFNNLKGQIPLGTQLQSFTYLSYMGNPQLCGTPLIEKRNHDNGDTKVMAENDEEGSELMESFYMGSGVGFAVSFWIVFGSILFKRSWRHAYFNFLYDLKDKFMSRWF
ncbi:receptor protein EIX2 [Trifolium repens]|nr:receptor protein EIX2 [Trifolium repens]